MAGEERKTVDPATNVEGRPVVPTVNWDDTHMRTSYANVVNASSTREEVAIFFGTNMTWSLNDKREFNVKLSDRVVLSPFAAKRLSILLQAILKEYENRFGKLEVPGAPPNT